MFYLIDLRRHYAQYIYKVYIYIYLYILVIEEDRLVVFVRTTATRYGSKSLRICKHLFQAEFACSLPQVAIDTMIFRRQDIHGQTSDLSSSAYLPHVCRILGSK